MPTAIQDVHPLDIVLVQLLDELELLLIKAWIYNVRLGRLGEFHQAIVI
jgi:hypothetical protein